MREGGAGRANICGFPRHIPTHMFTYAQDAGRTLSLCSETRRQRTDRSGTR